MEAEFLYVASRCCLLLQQCVQDGRTIVMMRLVDQMACRRSTSCAGLSLAEPVLVHEEFDSQAKIGRTDDWRTNVMFIFLHYVHRPSHRSSLRKGQPKPSLRLSHCFWASAILTLAQKRHLTVAEPLTDSTRNTTSGR